MADPGPALAETLSALLDSAPSFEPALVAAETGATQTYGQLADAVDGLASALAGLGVRRGDRVAFVVPNGPEFVQLLLATTALGAAAAPLNPAYTADEFVFYLQDLAPRVLVAPVGAGEAARRANDGAAVVADLVSDGENLPAIVGASVAAPAVEMAHPDDVALLLHTSGTTSRPKLVPLLHRNLMASTRSIAAHYRLTAADRSLCVMPLFHVHGLVASSLASLVAGGVVVVPGRLTPAVFWESLTRHRVTWYSAGPTLHRMFLDRPGRIGTDPPSLRFVRSCSSALDPALLERAEAHFAAPMIEAYGMTEASHEMAANELPPGVRRPGTVGVPTGAEIRIVDETGRDVPAGSAGEVVIRGPGVTPGYVDNPRANAEAFRDGWFQTGDQGVFEDARLRLIGRLKELIIRGGENISPAEIEDVLRAHPSVADAAVFGIPDDKYGEVVAAAVSLASAVEERALTDHCRTRLLPVKVPSVIHIVDEIARTPTGKLQRRRIAAAIYGE